MRAKRQGHSFDKGIPIPPAPRPKYIGANQKKIAAMEVGDSFLEVGATAPNVHSRFGAPAKKLGYKLTIRTLEEGVRVWRTA